jgi:hypothetical protein
MIIDDRGEEESRASRRGRRCLKSTPLASSTRRGTHVAERTAALDQVDLRWPTDRPKGEMRRRTRRIQGGEETRCSTGTGCSAGGRDERTSGTRTKTAVRMADEGGSVDHLCPWWGDTVGSSSFLFFRTLRDRPGPFLRIRSLPCASIPPADASCARDAVSSLSSLRRIPHRRLLSPGTLSENHPTLSGFSLSRERSASHQTTRASSIESLRGREK